MSPAYSLVSKVGKLGYLMKLLTPGLVFVDDANAFTDAIHFNVPVDTRSCRFHRRSAGPVRGQLSDLLVTQNMI